MTAAMTLDQWLRDQGMTEAEFARRIECAQATVNRYRQRQRMPSPEKMRRIWQATEGAVTANDFAGIEAAA
jgi:transcriptional regulator with XRE-family HTH domain